MIFGFKKPGQLGGEGDGRDGQECGWFVDNLQFVCLYKQVKL